MAASLFGYFCTMVTACIVLMMAMSHVLPPAKFRQPHWVVANTQTKMPAEVAKAPDQQRIAGTRL